MSGIFGSGGSSSKGSIYGGAARSSEKGSSLLGKLVHGVSKGVGNLGSDLLHTATGIPGGLVHTAEHPIGSLEAIGKSTWHDWSPLFEGHLGTFGKQFYDHPLAPLLDIATVFTAGGSAAAKLGATFGEEGSALANLSKAGELKYTRPADFTEKQPGLGEYSKTTSTNPVVRIRQQLIHNTITSLDGHVPKMFSDHMLGNAAGYNRSRLREMMARHAAMNAQNADTVAAVTAQVGAMLHAGKVLSTEDGRRVVEPQVLAHNYFNMRRHAEKIGVNDPVPAGYRYVREFTQQNQHRFFAFNPKVTLEARLRNFGRFYTTRQAKDAALVNGGKHALVVPVHDMNALGLEGANTASMVMKLWAKPSHLWKMATVGYSPKMVINNAVGNWLMYAMRQSGVHSARGVLDAIHYAKGEKAALHAVKSGSLTAAQYMDRGWMQRYFRDEVHAGNTFMGSVLQAEGKLGKRSGFKQGLHPLVHKVADQPVRVAAIHAELRNAPEVRRLTEKGMSFDKAANAALRADKTGLQKRVAEHARTIAGDYTRMTPMEQIVRQIIPFYAWDKHITKHTLNLASERPGLATALAGIGQQGSNALAGQFGALPDYMLSEVPIGTDKATGRQKMFDARGLNPYSSAGEIGAAALGHNGAGFESIASQVNPLAIAMAGLLSQRASDAARGGGSTPVKGQGAAGFLTSTLSDAFSNVPELTLLKNAIGGTRDTRTTAAGNVKPLLNEKSLRDTLLTYLAGLPVKRVDIAHAQQLEEQATGKKHKKSAGIYG